MTGPALETAHDRDLQRRLQGVLTVLQDRLLPDDQRLVDELIWANECGVALETIADALSEEMVEIEQATVDEIARLAETMGLSTGLAERLQPLGVG